MRTHAYARVRASTCCNCVASSRCISRDAVHTGEEKWSSIATLTIKLFAAPVNAPVMLSFDRDRHMYYYLYPPLVITRSGRASGDRLGSCAKAFYHIPRGLLGSGAYRFRLSGVIPPWSRPPDTFTSPLPDPSEILGSYVGPGLDRQTPHANHPCMQQLGGDIIGREGCLETTI